MVAAAQPFCVSVTQTKPLKQHDVKDTRSDFGAN